MKMPKLRKGSKGDSNRGLLDCESGILPLKHGVPHDCSYRRQHITLKNIQRFVGDNVEHCHTQKVLNTVTNADICL